MILLLRNQILDALEVVVQVLNAFLSHVDLGQVFELGAQSIDCVLKFIDLLSLGQEHGRPVGLLGEQLLLFKLHFDIVLHDLLHDLALALFDLLLAFLLEGYILFVRMLEDKVQLENHGLDELVKKQGSSNIPLVIY